MGAMKRLLERYVQGILDFMFPDGMQDMTDDERDMWNDRAYEAALKIDEVYPDVD